LPLGSLAIV
jgi:hypothetical protein